MPTLAILDGDDTMNYDEYVDGENLSPEECEMLGFSFRKLKRMARRATHKGLNIASALSPQAAMMIKAGRNIKKTVDTGKAQFPFGPGGKKHGRPGPKLPPPPYEKMHRRMMRHKKSGSSSSGSMTPLLIGGAALAAIVLMKK